MWAGCNPEAFTFGGSEGGDRWSLRSRQVGRLGVGWSGYHSDEGCILSGAGRKQNQLVG